MLYRDQLPEFDSAPQRVVSLIPSMTETLFELNIGDRMIACTDYCIHPASKLEHLPRVGGTKNPDIERIIEFRPDLVLMNEEENRKADAEALVKAGIPVWVTFPHTVAETINLLWDIVSVFDETMMVPRLRLIEQLLDWVRGISEQKPKLPSVFVPIWLDPLMTFNSQTYMHDLLLVCGAINVFADRERLYPLKADLGLAEAYPEERLKDRDTRYPRISFEELEKAQPEIILLPDEPFKFDESHLALFANLDVPAARNNRIHLIDGSLLTWHGIRLAYALDYLPKLLDIL